MRNLRVFVRRFVGFLRKDQWDHELAKRSKAIS